MYLPFNPLTLRKHLREYISKYAKQARVIVHLKYQLAKHIKENDRLLRENHRLKQMVKDKGARIAELNELLIKQVDLARIVKFNSLPRKERREILRGNR